MFGLFDVALLKIEIPEYVMMEDSIECIIEIDPSKKTPIRKVELELYGMETAIRRATTDAYYRNRIFSDVRIPIGKTSLTPGKRESFREIFRLPDLTAPTILASNHRIQWFVRARIDVPWWPDTRMQKEFRVLPCLCVPESSE